MHKCVNTLLLIDIFSFETNKMLQSNEKYMRSRGEAKP